MLKIFNSDFKKPIKRKKYKKMNQTINKKKKLNITQFYILIVN